MSTDGMESERPSFCIVVGVGNGPPRLFNGNGKTNLSLHTLSVHISLCLLSKTPVVSHISLTSECLWRDAFVRVMVKDNPLHRESSSDSLHQRLHWMCTRDHDGSSTLFVPAHELDRTVLSLLQMSIFSMQLVFKLWRKRSAGPLCNGSYFLVPLSFRWGGHCSLENN